MARHGETATRSVNGYERLWFPQGIWYFWRGDRGEAVAGGRAWVGVDTVIPETLYILHFGLSDVSMIERFLRSVDQLFRALSIDYPGYQLKQ